jgi:hypothetical protein
MTPHSIKSAANPDDPKEWRALCGRHQVMKKNYWDNSTNKLNVYAIVQSASKKDKRRVLRISEGLFQRAGQIVEVKPSISYLKLGIVAGF